MKFICGPLGDSTPLTKNRDLGRGAAGGRSDGDELSLGLDCEFEVSMETDTARRQLIR